MSELDLKASDRDRERTLDALRAHAADGRLTLDELEERVQRALAARTLDDLAALTRDLPDRASAAPPARRRGRRPAGPELTTFLAVMLLLTAIWAVTGAGYFWPMWPMVGWGAFVLGPRHGLGFLVCHPSGSSRR